MFYVRHPNGHAFSHFGWQVDPQRGLHWRSAEDAREAMRAETLPAGCTVAPVPPKVQPGQSRLTKPIFSGG